MDDPKLIQGSVAKFKKTQTCVQNTIVVEADLNNFCHSLYAEKTESDERLRLCLYSLNSFNPFDCTRSMMNALESRRLNKIIDVSHADDFVQFGY